jgi:hypothetical protein
MKILKKNYKLNLLDYKHFLKNLNLQKKLYKKQELLFNNQILLNINNFNIIDLNYKQENLFYPNYNNNIKNFIYFIKKNYNNNLLIESNNYNYYLLKLYIYFLLKKSKFKSNKIIKGRIIKIKKQKVFVLIFGLILSMKKKELHKKKNFLYSKFKYKKLFFYYLLKSLNFKLLLFKINKKKKKIIFSRKIYVRDLKK